MKHLIALLISSAAFAQTAVEWNNRGAQLYAAGNFRGAEDALLKALDGYKAAPTSEADRGQTLFNLAAVYRAQDNLAQAEDCIKQAARLLPESGRTNSQLVLAAIYSSERRYSDASELLLPLSSNASAAVRAVAFTTLGSNASAQNDAAKAEEYALLSLAAAREAYPARHPAEAVALNNLAQAYRFQGNYLKAEPAYRQAVDIWRDALGAWHPDLARGLANFAAFYHERQREAGAEELYRRAIAIYQRAFGDDNPQTLAAKIELADVLRGQRRYSEATRMLKPLVAGLESATAADDPRVLRAHAVEKLLASESVRSTNALR